MAQAVIVKLPNTTTSKITKEIVKLREQGGVVALGRVLTLVVITRSGFEEDAIAAANMASREHPCRIIVLAAGSASESNRLDGEIRVGGDAGADESHADPAEGRHAGLQAVRRERIVPAIRG